VEFLIAKWVRNTLPQQELIAVKAVPVQRSPSFGIKTDSFRWLGALNVLLALSV